MFIRSVKVPSSNGTVHEYVRIVGSVRENGKVKQKVIANLGRRDTLEAVLPLLNRFLQGDDEQKELERQLAQDGPVEILDASTWGPMLITRHFFEQLGLRCAGSDGHSVCLIRPLELSTKGVCHAKEEGRQESSPV